jgi:hypothetical protein
VEIKAVKKEEKKADNPDIEQIKNSRLSSRKEKKSRRGGKEKGREKEDNETRTNPARQPHPLKSRSLYSLERKNSSRR